MSRLLGGPRLTRAAYIAAASNLVASLVMLLLLRAGLPVNGSSAQARLAFIRGHTAAWQLGWLSWNIAAVTLIGFFLALAMANDRRRWVSTLAVLCGVAGLAADLTAEALIMGVEPSTSVATFLILERVTLVLTGYVANGLYSMCGAMLTLNWRGIPRSVAAVAVPLWVSGFTLSFATLVDMPWLEVMATVATMVLFVVWAVLVGRWSAANAS